jgi:hypothetical protein
MVSYNIKAKIRGVNGEVYLSVLEKRMIPACEALMAKMPVVEAQHQWILQQDNGEAHVCKKDRNWLSSQCNITRLDKHMLTTVAD